MKKGRIRLILAMLLLAMTFGTVSAQAGGEAPAARAAAVKQGWKKIGGKKYYINASGKHKTGWFTYEGKRYYLNPKADGAAVTGLKKIGGKYYCFNKAGQMLKNKWAYLVGKKYYAIDSKGVARKMSAVEEQAVRQLK